MRNKKLFIAAIVLCMLGAFAFVGIQQLGKGKLEENIVLPDITEGTEITADGQSYEVVEYRGQEYQYRDDIINILCLGIDKEEFMSQRNDGDGSVGQADAIFLLSLDLKENQIRLIAVPRDTMVTLEMYRSDGTYLGDTEGQITLQYAYGDGQELSATLTAKRVSEIMNNIPINGYLAVNVRCLWKMNEAIGGVYITMDDDYTAYNPLFEKGATVYLSGSNLENYIRGRDKLDIDGAYKRMHRMKQYMLAFFEQAKKVAKEDLTIPLQVMEQLKYDMETDITMDGAVYLLTKALKCEFSEADMHTLPGYNILEERYVEFCLDEEGVTELIIDLFYEEK